MSSKLKSCPQCGKKMDKDEEIYHIGFGKTQDRKRKCCVNCFDEMYK